MHADFDVVPAVAMRTELLEFVTLAQVLDVNGVEVSLDVYPNPSVPATGDEPGDPFVPDTSAMA